MLNMIQTHGKYLLNCDVIEKMSRISKICKLLLSTLEFIWISVTSGTWPRVVLLPTFITDTALGSLGYRLKLIATSICSYLLKTEDNVFASDDERVVGRSSTGF